MASPCTQASALRPNQKSSTGRSGRLGSCCDGDACNEVSSHHRDRRDGAGGVRRPPNSLHQREPQRVSMSSRGPNIAPLSIRNAVRAGRLTLALTGELDLDSANKLEEAVREVCASGTGLVIDLRKVTFL